MSNGASSTNDISDDQRKKLLRFVEINRKQRRSVKAHKQDKGECWSLAFMALRSAGADEPCRNCGDAALYIWGRRIAQSELAPGDVIQIEGPAELTNKSNTRVLRFPHQHHTMVVMEVQSPGADGAIVKVAHQWAGTKVHYNTVRLGSKIGTGVMHYYRLQSTK